jgi:hypothetical protein
VIRVSSLSCTSAKVVVAGSETYRRGRSGALSHDDIDVARFADGSVVEALRAADDDLSSELARVGLDEREQRRIVKRASLFVQNDDLPERLEPLLLHRGNELEIALRIAFRRGISNACRRDLRFHDAGDEQRARDAPTSRSRQNQKGPIPMHVRAPYTI